MNAYVLIQSGIYYWICFAKDLQEAKQTAVNYFKEQIDEVIEKEGRIYFVFKDGTKMRIKELLNIQNKTIFRI